MGFKRPFDDEELQELPFKHSRPLDYSDKLTQFDEVFSCQNVSQKPAVAVEDGGNFCKYEGGEASEGDGFDEDPNHIHKDFVASAPFSCVTKSSSEEDGSGATTHSSLSHEYFELDIPQRTFIPFEDSYSFLLDRSPRKQVPLGPDHQASIPIWGVNIKDEKLDQSEALQSVDNDEEERLMGTCIIPMPDSSSPAPEDCKAGEGRKECVCLDKGSVRCTRQHVMEARNELIENIGYENFANLGFCEMGEEVAHKWSEEEEQLFQEVVYSNPFSLGRNFWKSLSAVFPSRTKKETVSYYFNVFILRRRAVQNRSRLLDVDSDDDEWHGSYGGYYRVRCSEEDEGSAIESPFHLDFGTDHRRLSTLQDEEDEDEETDSEDDGDDGCEDGEENGAMLSGDCECNQHVGKFSGSTDVGDDSCMSFELQQNMVDPHGHFDNGTAMRTDKEKNGLGEYQQSKLDGCNDPVSQAYLFESCDAKDWDARLSAIPTKAADLLPTRSIIEEIFGQGTWDNKAGNE